MSKMMSDNLDANLGNIEKLTHKIKREKLSKILDTSSLNNINKKVTNDLYDIFFDKSQSMDDALLDKDKSKQTNSKSEIGSQQRTYKS
jgi:hypothetical protein